MASVTLENVSKTYPGVKGPDVVAVQDFNLKVMDREFVVFVGPSGCGKSTTLRMIAGLEEITSGDILIDGRRVNEVPPKDRDIAMVFQNYALYPHMSVYENMAFGLKLRRYSKAEIDRRVTEAATLLGIESLFARRPKALSGGQRQRVALGRAIVRQPAVFLFDEPLSNLDAKMRVQMRTEITKLHQRLKATMIYVTHDQVEAMTMGTRIVVMKDGVIQQVDAPLNLYHQPGNLFVAGFLGSPPMNLINGVLKSNGGRIQFVQSGEEAVRVDLVPSRNAESYPGREVVLGFRPEDCQPAAQDARVSMNSFAATIELTEPMGAETYFHLKVGGVSVICRSRLPADHGKDGQRMTFCIDADHIHLFDPVTTRRI